MPRQSDEVTVRAPGSIANLGPGFDVFALSSPYDLLTVETTAERGVRLRVAGQGSESIPLEPESNTAGRVAWLFIREFDLREGFRITIHKGIRPGFGLGSSEADAAAAAYALNRILDLDLSDNELVALAAQGEIAASDIAHADNVSASLLGGFTIIRSYNHIEVLRYDPPENLGICIAIPEIEPPPKKTAQARKALPQKATLVQLTHNVGHAASIVCGMLTKDISLIGGAMDDIIVELIRSQFIPGYKHVRAAVLKHGAAGVAICGAGPSIAVFFDTGEADPKHILKGMTEGFQSIGVGCKTIITRPGGGAQIVKGDASLRGGLIN